MFFSEANALASFLNLFFLFLSCVTASLCVTVSLLSPSLYLFDALLIVDNSLRSSGSAPVLQMNWRSPLFWFGMLNIPRLPFDSTLDVDKPVCFSVNRPLLSLSLIDLPPYQSRVFVSIFTCSPFVLCPRTCGSSHGRLCRPSITSVHVAIAACFC